MSLADPPPFEGETPAPGPDSDSQELIGKVSGATRRTFIRDLALAGASTTAALYGLDEAGVADLVATAQAAPDEDASLSEFTAIAASAADRVEVPPGFAHQVVIRWGDEFANTDGTTYTYGFNCDYLAYFPLRGSEEGLLFVNHEYPDPFFQHGHKPLKAGTGGAAPSPRPGGKTTKSLADVDAEKEATGNSIVHVRRDARGAWAVVTPSPYNRRIFGGDVPGMPATPLSFTGPLAKAGAPGSKTPDAKVHGADNLARGSMANCSGGITPWGTALSCEENYDGYGLTFKGSTFDFTYGWDSVDPSRPRTEQQDGSYAGPAAEAAEYDPTTNGPRESRKYGWVCEHDVYDPQGQGRKHTALGRFRHENTAFRQVRGKKFVLYMGDDQANQAVYKFVSTREFKRSDARAEHLEILTEGQLYVARWEPEGRRRFAAAGGAGGVVTPTSGTGTWVPVADEDLFDTRLRLAGFPSNEVAAPDPGAPDNKPLPVTRRGRQQTSRAGSTDPSDVGRYAGRYNRLVNAPGGEPFLGDGTAPAGFYNEWERHFATNRPEDVEVGPDGSVFIALTNNTSASGYSTNPNDPFGAVRRLVEAGNDPEATTFTWEEFAAGGDKGGTDGERGFASPDNLVFDDLGNIWVVTDISSSSLNRPGVYEFHKNNAVFMIPADQVGGRRVAYRFANMPVQSEATGPYFTPDESTLFLNVQHPGEEAKNSDTSVFGDPTTYSSYFPDGNKTTGENPSTPKPSTVAIYRPRVVDPGEGIGEPGPDGQVPTPPPVAPGPQVPSPPAPGSDLKPPTVIVRRRPRSTVRGLLRSGVSVTLRVDEAATLRVELVGRIRYRSGGKRRTLGRSTLATARRTVGRAETVTLRLRPSVLARLQLRRDGADVVAERLRIEAVDRAGNRRTTSHGLTLKR